ncbi:type III PLP-dependent enzyme [Rickettsiales bacterium]|nr:type III PLP-dependent enzyme [Rickettsiales bacterium]
MLLDLIKIRRLITNQPTLGDGHFGISDDSIRKLNSSIPISVIETNLIQKQAQDFVGLFPGKAMYAVKCNPDKIFLKFLYAGGIDCFDAASLGEIKLIRKLFPRATIYFMHPIKSPEAIFAAYYTHGVKSFVIDCRGELDKIMQTLPDAKDLELFVRIGVSGGNVATDFSTKFGAKLDDAVSLLKACRQRCKSLGVAFHVGTQCIDPEIYGTAIRYAANLVVKSGVTIECLDIGGGFPADLDINKPLPPLKNYMDVISNALDDVGLENVKLLCEAGRGLVANGGSLVVRIEGRKDDILYINDGTYGGLFEAGGAIGLSYPARLIRKEGRDCEKELIPFRFAGPTCDSVDMMNGPFMLPRDAKVGDWISLDKLGAYGEVSRTNFNGFGEVKKIIINESRS